MKTTRNIKSLLKNNYYISLLSFLFSSLFILHPYCQSFAQCTMMIDQDFNHWNNRKYTVADAKNDFNNKIKPWTASTYRGISAPGADASLIGDVAQETRIVNGELRAEYKKDDAGGYAGVFLFDPYFDGVEEAYLEYKVKFDENFFWATGGKLPGLGGSTQGINSESSGRGAIPSGGRYDENGTGFSARLMWRRNRAQTDKPYFILYSYFAEKPDGTARKDGEAGDAIRLYTGLEDNKWYTVRQYIKLNTPGQDNGTVVMWINGEEVYRNTKHNIRQAGKGNLKINALIMNTYRGGSRTDPVWHSPRDEYAFFDDFKVWTGCSEPPGNTNQAPTGAFEAPTFNTIEEGYSELYVKVAASDPDGDAITLTLKIDGVDHRGTPEGSAPYEWGHTTSPKLDETLNLTPGVHEFEVVITDSKGASTSIKKLITVTAIPVPNKLPTVEITSPANNNIFFVGDNILITANAQDEDGTIDKVNFKLDGGYHSQDRTAYGIEYTTTFTPTEAGTYVLGARAFDNEGGATEVSITVEVQLVTGTEDVIESKFSVYPNPTSGLVYLSMETHWELYSTQSIKIKEGFGQVIELKGLEKGVYILKTDDGVISLVHQ